VTWALGNVLLGQTYQSKTAGTNVAVMTLKNWGAGVIDVDISAAASAPGGWTNGAAINTDVYKLEWSVNDGTSWTAVTTSAKVKDEWASGSTTDFDLKSRFRRPARVPRRRRFR